MKKEGKEKTFKAASAAVARLKSAFESFEDRFGSRLSKRLQPIRAEAFSRFSETGFPTTRDEKWRFTSLAPLEETAFKPAFNFPQPKVSRSDVDQLIRLKNKWPEFIFLNGFLARGLSRNIEELSGVEIGSFSEALCRDEKETEGFLRSIEPAKSVTETVAGKPAGIPAGEPEVFTDLNTAFFSEGALIDVKAGVIVSSPIHLVFISADGNDPMFSQPRNFIRVGKNAKLTVIEEYASLAGESTYWTNVVTDLFLNEGAEFTYLRLQRESESAFHISTVNAELKRASFFSSSQIDLGGRLVRNNLNVRLLEPEAGCELNGLYLTHGDQHVDNCTFINHPAPQGKSRQLYKGIVAGESHAVFGGKILVGHGAHETEAHQTNKNLLLSSQAVVDTKPHLEIFTGDVQCTHGAAVGELNEDGIFYLESRGLSEAKAREILAYGFANEVIQKIPVPEIRGELERVVLERLASGGA